MTEQNRRMPSCAVWVLTWGLAGAWTSAALAEKAAAPPKKGPAGKKSPKGKPAPKKKDAKPGAKKAKGGDKKGGMALSLKPPKSKKKSAGPIVVPKPVWNREAGFGLPVPTGWTGKVEGAKIVLTSPDPPAKRTTITMGPEPTELEARQYLMQLCRQMAEKDKTMTLPQKPIEILDVTIYLVGYPDLRATPPGFGALLVMDRPGDQVFVFRVLTRNKEIMNDMSVKAALGMLCFRDGPLVSLSQLMDLGKKKEKLPVGKVPVKAGTGTLAELRIPRLIFRKARDMKFKGEMHRYRMAIAAPKGYQPKQAWPVLILDAPASMGTIAPYQPLADAMGLIVLAIEAQTPETNWPPEIQARVYFAALGRLISEMTIDRSRVYLMGIGPDAAKAQTVAALLPMARGVICCDAKDDALSAALSKSPDAKSRLAAVVAHVPATKMITQAQADALVAAWKKAGAGAAQACKGKNNTDAAGQAVTFLLQRDRNVMKAQLPKLLAQANKIKKSQSGQALTIYRRIVGSGLKGAQVDQAKQAAKELMDEYGALTKVITTQRADPPADEVIAQFKVAQRFRGTPEGRALLRMLRSKLEAQ